MKRKFSLGQEFIGKKITIITSACKFQNGLQGEIIDETQNTLTLETKNGLQKTFKNQIKFCVDGSDLIIDGKKIMKKPEERLKLRIQNE